MSGSRVIIRYNHIPQAKRMVAQNMSALVMALAFELQRYAQQSMGSSRSSPGEPPGVDTGALRASIYAEMVSTFVALVLVGVAYGVHLEYGTSRMAARPFMWPALIWASRQVGRLANELEWSV
jgi:hypothetical protein